MDRSLSITHQSYTSTLELSPHPTCVLDMTRSLVYGNSAFWVLYPEKNKLLAHQIDLILGTRLSSIAMHDRNATQQQLIVSLPLSHTNNRHFSVVSWPTLSSGTLAGRIITFYEQTHTAEKKNAQANFELQLIRYMVNMSEVLKAFSQRLNVLKPEQMRSSLSSLETEIGEMVHAAEYLEATHSIIRSGHRSISVQLSPLVKDVLIEQRTNARPKKIQIVSSLGKNIVTLGNPADVQFLIHTLLSTAITLSKSGDHISLSVYKEANKIKIITDLPNTHFPERQMKNLLDFSESAISDDSLERIWRLQLAVMKELTVKLNGYFSITSDSSFGTTITTTLCAVDTK